MLTLGDNLTHSIPVDSSGIAINWFTTCGKHVVFMPKKDTLDNATPDCPQCLLKAGVK